MTSQPAEGMTPDIDSDGSAFEVHPLTGIGLALQLGLLMLCWFTGDWIGVVINALLIGVNVTVLQIRRVRFYRTLDEIDEKYRRYL